MPPMIEFPLDLPEVRVLKTELKKREIVITVESTRPYAICSRCGEKTFEFHSYDDPIRLRHLPILEQRVIIELRPKRYRSPTCDDQPTTTQQCDWYEPRSPHTKAFDQSLLRQLIKSTVSDVARKQEVSYDSVLGAINRGLQRAVNWKGRPEAAGEWEGLTTRSAGRGIFASPPCSLWFASLPFHVTAAIPNYSRSSHSPAFSSIIAPFPDAIPEALVLARFRESRSEAYAPHDYQTEDLE